MVRIANKILGQTCERLLATPLRTFEKRATPWHGAPTL